MLQIVEKPWGHYSVFYDDGKNIKVKELYVLPEKSLSMQKHFKRAEEWFVASGFATVWTSNDYDGVNILQGVYKKFDKLTIPKGTWHRLENQASIPLKIIEIQYGEECLEEDILRK
jgi:mannose-6-phosphate isomerase-like protein (cupin superfamily)